MYHLTSRFCPEISIDTRTTNSRHGQLASFQRNYCRVHYFVSYSAGDLLLRSSRSDSTGDECLSLLLRATLTVGKYGILKNSFRLQSTRKAHFRMQRLTNQMISSRCELNEIMILHFEEYIKIFPRSRIAASTTQSRFSCFSPEKRSNITYSLSSFQPLSTSLSSINIHPKNCLYSVRSTT